MLHNLESDKSDCFCDYEDLRHMLWRKDTYKPLLNIYGDQGNYNDPIKFWCRNDNNLYGAL